MARLDDGFSTQITFGSFSSVNLWEKEVTPPGMSAGGANETTTMRNTTYRTKAPKKLISLDDMELNVAYDPAIYGDIIAMLGKNQQITVTFSDDSSLTFWGWVDAFKPGSIQEGSQPTASITIICSNEDDSEPAVETAPSYGAGS
jgi:hypothetical protein